MAEYNRYDDQDTRWFWELPINNPQKFREAEPRHTDLRKMNRRLHGRQLWKSIFRKVERQAPGVQRFVLLAFPRSGSSLLKWWLHRHPDLLMHGELFNPKTGYHILSNKMDKGLRQDTLRHFENKNSDPAKTMEAVWLAGGNYTRVGFKLQADHLPWKIVDNLLLKDPGVKKIVLKRRNIMASYVSFEKGWQHDAWLFKRTSKFKVRVRLDDFKNTISVFDAWYNLLDRALAGQQEDGGSGNVLQIYYDDISTTPRLKRTLKKVYEFLGVSSEWRLVSRERPRPGEDPSLKMVKQNTAPMEASVTNYEETMDMLRSRPEYKHVIDGLQYA